MTEYYVKAYAPKEKHNFGLEKEGRSKAPGCYDVFQCKLNDKSNRWVTGLDEYAPEVLALPAEERQLKQKELIEQRAEFETLLGLAPNTLRADNEEYWSNFYIKLNEQVRYNPSIPLDRLTMLVARASGYVPFSYEEAMNPELGEVKFYIEEKHGNVKKTVANRRKKDKAISRLLEVEDDFSRMINLANYLHMPGIDKDIPKDNLYEILSTFIEKNTSNAEDFNKAFEITPEDLSLSLLFDEALRSGVIRAKEGKFQRGNITYGLSREEAMSTLKKMEFDAEVKSIKKEVENKRKFGNG